MKMKMLLFILLLVQLLITGCITTGFGNETKPLSSEKKQAYINKTKDPRIFGMDLVQAPAGVEIRGGGRLNDRHAVVRSMKVKEPWRPVVDMKDGAVMSSPVLLDLVSPYTWMEFRTAEKLGAHAVAERKPVLIQLPGDDISACLSTMKSLRFGILSIDYPLVYVRMATGSIGPLARDIEDPALKGVIGWDLLHKFELIQFQYAKGEVLLSVSGTYEPNPDHLVATIPIVKSPGGCTVRVKVNGKEVLAAIDPAGDFEVAMPATAPVLETFEIGKDLILSNPKVSLSPSGVRIGAQFLKNYQVSICPKIGRIYFELIPEETD